MSSSGVNRVDGRPLSNFEHVRQSIEVILTTAIGSRVMRREFGSEVLNLIDRPLTDRVILAVYSAVVMAIAQWEPRFAVTGCEISRADETGKLSLQIFGIYYPRGHLGDFSRPEDAQTRVFFERQ
ncbi:MAG TPA: GPW/gp25 family protein [Ochrobactrum sp.]|nr:GPW/gp25 family protein [Ochrobactrum sp.]